MSEDIKALAAEIKEAAGELKNYQAKAETESKKYGEELEQTKSQLKDASEKLADLKSDYEAKLERIDGELKSLASKRHSNDQEVKTLGKAFIESEAYELAKEGKHEQRLNVSRKDLTGTSGSAIGAVIPGFDPTIYRFIGGQRQLRIRDLLPVIPENSGSVEVMRITSVTDEAGPQQPGTPSTAQGAGELQTKPKSDMVITRVSIPMRTMAHHMIASRQVLRHAPRLQAEIDRELVYGLQLLSDDQLLNGNGTNQNLTGILNDANINDVGDVAFGTTAAQLPGAMINHIRAAITQCQQAEYYNMNGLVLNPVDWQTLETARATDGHYLLVPFAATGSEAQSIWRVPIVVTNAIAAGSFLVGDWNLGAAIYQGESVTVRSSEHHANLFVQNGVAILAEEEYCLGINRPKAFTAGSFAVAASS
jgi:HK97 family phage major capsid protein